MSSLTEAREGLVAQRAQKKARRDEIVARNNDLMAKSGGEAINADSREEFRVGLNEAQQLRAEIEALTEQIDSIPAEDSNETMEELSAGDYDPKNTPFRRWVKGLMNQGPGLTAEETRQYIGEGGFRMDVMAQDVARRQIARITAAEGMRLLSTDEAKSAKGAIIAELDKYAAFSTPSDGSGVPVTTPGFVTKQLRSFKGIKPISTVVTTAMGENWEYPVYADEDRIGEFSAEDQSSNTAADEGVDMQHVDLGSHSLSSKLFTVSRKLILNASYNVEEFVRGQLMRSLSKAENAAYSTGSGTNAPTGYRGLATSAFTSAAATAITYGELIRLMHSLDVSYRYAEAEGDSGLTNQIGGKGACWVMHDTVLGYIRNLEDTDGRRVWERDYQVGAPDRLFGFPVQVDQNANALTNLAPVATNLHVFFGDFSYYVVRESGPMTVDMVLDFDRVGKNNVGMLLWAYRDGNVVSPRISSKVEVIQAITQAAS